MPCVDSPDATPTFARSLDSGGFVSTSLKRCSYHRSAIPPVFMSALIVGFGQAFSWQPVKVALFMATGMTLSTAGGLNPWIARNVFGAKQTRFRPSKIRKPLLAIWAAP